MENYNGQQYNTQQPVTYAQPMAPMQQPITYAQPIAQTAPAAPKRKGRKMAAFAMIMAIATHIILIVISWFLFWLQYGRENMAVIRISFVSMILVVPAILSLVFGGIAKARGAGKGMWIATLINAIFCFGWLFFCFRMLIFDIGSTF
jgi:hypothetical protein